MSGDRGPCSKYDINIPEGNFKGELEIVWESDPLRVSIVLLYYRVCSGKRKKAMKQNNLQACFFYNTLLCYSAIITVIQEANLPLIT